MHYLRIYSSRFLDELDQNACDYVRFRHVEIPSSLCFDKDENNYKCAIVFVCSFTGQKRNVTI